jgi:hypothetical protein
MATCLNLEMLCGLSSSPSHYYMTSGTWRPPRRDMQFGRRIVLVFTVVLEGFQRLFFVRPGCAISIFTSTNLLSGCRPRA